MANGDDQLYGPAASQMPDFASWWGGGGTPGGGMQTAPMQTGYMREIPGSFQPASSLSPSEWARLAPAFAGLTDFPTTGSTAAPAAVPTSMAPAPAPGPAPGSVPGNFPNQGVPLAGQTGPPMPWSAVGGPASMAAAPPSAFTPSNPAEAARWAQASTPQGYAQMLAQAQAAAAADAQAGIRHNPNRVREGQDFSGGQRGPANLVQLPVWQQAPVVTGGGTSAPVGGTQGFAGVPGAPGGPSGATVAPGQPGYFQQIGRDLTDFYQHPVQHVLDRLPGFGGATPAQASAALPGYARIPPRMPMVSGGGTPAPAGGFQGFAGVPGAPGTPGGPGLPPLPSAQATAALPGYAQIPGRQLSDAEIARLRPEDILNTVGRPDLTNADRAALQQRLTEMQLGLRGG